MPWNDVIEQSGAVRMLRSAIASGRVAHAYLFHGPAGVGKRAVALEFSRALQCEREEDEACGQCRPCVKASRLTHPDIHVMLPQPSDATIDDVRAWNRTLAAEPYTAVDYAQRPTRKSAKTPSNKLAFFHIARIQEDLRPRMSLRPVEGPRKIVVMADVDRMRVEAANAFLKLLEEPAPQTVFLLTTSRQDLLLPTILSRCQRVGFAALPAKVIQDALLVRQGIPPDRALALSRMADGSYSRALDLAHNEDLMEDRRLVLEFMRTSYTQAIHKQADIIQDLANAKRERVKRVLRLALSWIRDLLIQRTPDATTEIVNVDQAQTVARFVLNLPDADIGAMVNLVEEALFLVERAVNVKLVLTTLSQSLASAMRASHDGRLYIPLTG